MTDPRWATRPVPSLVRDPLLVVYVYVLTSFLIPTRSVIAPLGSMGSPATLVSVLALVLWLYGRLVPQFRRAPRVNPVTVLLGSYFMVVLVSYAAGAMRMMSAVEARSSDRLLIQMLGYLGLAMLIIDAVRNRAHLERLVKVLVACASIVALMGIVQFFTYIGPESYVKIPGLVAHNEPTLSSRATFERVKATAGHPLEFGVVLTTLLPLALYRALRHPAAAPGWPRVRRWLPAIAILVATPTAVSRSGVLALLVGGLVMAGVMTRRQRFNLLVAALLLTVAMRVAFPGLLGTIRSLFAFMGADPSISGRTDDYPLIEEYFHERPWFGRGLGTFIPERYFFLDNQYLGNLMEGGVVSLVGLVLLFLVPIVAGRWMVRQARTTDTAFLAQAMVAAAAVSAATWATYDGMGFKINAGLLFVMLGVTGALWRLESSAATRDDGAGLPASALRTHGTEVHVNG